MSASTFSASRATALMKEIFSAKNAFEACLMISALCAEVTNRRAGLYSLHGPLNAEPRILMSLRLLAILVQLDSAAMEAGLTDHIWKLEELCGLIPAENPIQRIYKELILKALRKTACRLADDSQDVLATV
jgi:hypothetical protein